MTSQKAEMLLWEAHHIVTKFLDKQTTYFAPSKAVLVAAVFTQLAQGADGDGKGDGA